MSAYAIVAATVKTGTGYQVNTIPRIVKPYQSATDMSRIRIGERVTPEELAVRLDYENRMPARHRAALEAADPSQRRPKKVPSIWDVVDFMAWDSYAVLGLQPLQPRRNLGFVPYNGHSE